MNSTPYDRIIEVDSFNALLAICTPENKEDLMQQLSAKLSQAMAIREMVADQYESSSNQEEAMEEFCNNWKVEFRIPIGRVSVFRTPWREGSIIDDVKPDEEQNSDLRVDLINGHFANSPF
jgi:hypothetical protein